MADIVVVEDERELATLVERALREEGHRVEVIRDGAAALERLTGPGQPEPDLIVLDLMLPNVDGLEICRRVRQSKITPILMLTARSTELDRVLGLELGADDYLTKPFSLRELQARVSAILRRVEMMRALSRTEDGTTRIDHGDLTIDPLSREVTSRGQPVHLTAKEFDLLHLLAANPGRVFSRDYLLHRVWGEDYVGVDRTVDTHILRLRKKLGGPGSPAERIVTLWGVGYKYERPRDGGA
ncbi:response regulator transcription factor [Sphaerobacter thermophilus]|uniref:Phosphate regulon transcriptional regulatory protein PhoB n=1 Tax=Sphaerobacter thermophilus (strain ATCC 49802 / DSM 20745 / KCCM 41009 / NCIMB 13125 / S 6022) TaxID=479434 RepID=D1C280_SPHTD|nr:response regulator transcription factor [Sphaerobacter thermophilus]ACZ38347.1 two component transcriptional regulator, winged helix family [Sphaerobacter thermophilus DSM 20745]PZN68196.1 MAG: DNA-binding response regulator [Sphaerobacter thermophilus]